MRGQEKTALLLSALCLLATASFARPAAAQATASPRQTIVLPLELAAGQPATLAVLGPDGRIAPGVKLVLSSGEVLTTDESGRAHFLQPTGAGIMYARIEGTQMREAADVMPQAESSVGLQISRMPRFAALQDHFSISGRGFQGDADQNRVKMSDQRILILASSPLQLIAVPPAKSVPGPSSLLIMEGTTEISVNLSLIDLATEDFDSPRIRRGKKASVRVHALGTAEPVDLLVQNLTPEVVEFPHGNEQRVSTAGGADNSAAVLLKSIARGSYSFRVSLEDTSMGVDAPVARDFLETAAKIAEPDASSRVAAVLRELRSGRVDAVKLRQELDGILAQGGSEDFQALIRGARRALAGE